VECSMAGRGNHSGQRMALAGAKLFVDEGAYVFISGRRKDALDEAVELIAERDCVQADSADSTIWIDYSRSSSKKGSD